jgi:phosphoenolpyruvate carboxykinase (ATP)
VAEECVGQDVAVVPCLAGHPSDVIFLTCDAFGVLPPVARLTPEQGMYHFISGYTAKMAGTEMGVTEPVATFSACFGAPFLVWHPAKYAELLAKKLKEHKANVWLINTGWSGGSYGTGSRIELKFTRAIINAIHAGTLNNASTQPDPIFGMQVVTRVAQVPAHILIPQQTWSDKQAFAAAARKLAGLFVENFKKFESGVTPDVKAAGPKAY